MKKVTQEIDGFKGVGERYDDGSGYGTVSLSREKLGEYLFDVICKDTGINKNYSKITIDTLDENGITFTIYIAADAVD